MERKIKFIYFDIGNVLVDWTDAFSTVSRKFHVPFSKFLKEWELYDDDITRGKITPQQFWSKVRRDLQITGGEDFDFLDSWVGDYKPIKQTHFLVRKLSRNYSIGLITNLYTGMLSKLLKKKLIPNVKYSAVVVSCRTGFRKPEKEIYAIATKRAGVRPQEIMLVDDRKDFVEAAKEAGWQAFKFDPKRPKRSVERLLSKLTES